jgi:hypothetical protein
LEAGFLNGQPHVLLNQTYLVNFSVCTQFNVHSGLHRPIRRLAPQLMMQFAKQLSTKVMYQHEDGSMVPIDAITAQQILTWPTTQPPIFRPCGDFYLTTGFAYTIDMTSWTQTNISTNTARQLACDAVLAQVPNAVTGQTAAMMSTANAIAIHNQTVTPDDLKGAIAQASTDLNKRLADWAWPCPSPALTALTLSHGVCLPTVPFPQVQAAAAASGPASVTVSSDSIAPLVNGDADLIKVVQPLRSAPNHVIHKLSKRVYLQQRPAF